LVPIAVPAIIGLAIGLYGGLRPSFSMSDAVKTAGTLASGFAAMMFMMTVPLFLYDAARTSARRDRWATAALGGIAVGAVLFVLSFSVLLAVLIWYSVCSGEGPWLGMLIGSSSATVPFALIAVGARQWPRWESMRVPRSPSPLNVTPVPAPTDMAPAAEPAPQVDPGIENKLER
jgi:hypothetical protein